LSAVTKVRFSNRPVVNRGLPWSVRIFVIVVPVHFTLYASVLLTMVVQLCRKLNSNKVSRTAVLLNTPTNETRLVKAGLAAILLR